MAKKSYCLKAIRIRGYKALKDFMLADIGPLNVVVGPNGSGKSALFEVVTLIRGMALGLPPYDIDGSLYFHFWPQRSQDGFSGVVHPEVGHIEIELNVTRDNTPYAYTLQLTAAGTAWVTGVAECDTVLETLITDKGQKLIYFSGERDHKAATGPGTLTAPKIYEAVINGKKTTVPWPHFHPLLLLNAPNDALSADPIFGELREYFQNWWGFKPHFLYLLAKGGQNLDSRLLTPGERFAGDRLDLPMGNLPQVLLRLKSQQPPNVYEDIWEIFHAAVVPGQAWGLEVEEISHQVFVALRGAAWPGGKYWLADWPDGWKAFLSWLVALRTAPSGAVVYLEEPENNLHPRLLAQLLEQIEMANQRGVQVFISTHSMELVNMIEPSELILMQEGKAHRLDLEKADKIREAGILLGSAWASGFLDDIRQTPASMQK